MKPQTKQQLWEVYCFLGEEQRHFNVVQEKYRLMASSWMLAALGAVGFVLNTSSMSDLKELIIGLVGLVASGGFMVLWAMDVHFYQNLISASYNEAMSLEQAQPWIPQVRKNMRLLLKGKGPTIVSRFYYFGVLVTGALAVYGLSMYIATLSIISAILAAIVLTFVIGFGASRMHFSPKENIKSGAEIINARAQAYAKYSSLFE